RYVFPGQQCACAGMTKQGARCLCWQEAKFRRAIPGQQLVRADMTNWAALHRRLRADRKRKKPQ
ncbi:hypothetical protein, partial [Azohydromonas lata]|uniref:hypothetical protein n=1 Tax=Azohydromonas lata TaxID=45677 RepID=UPI001C3F37AC